MRVTRRRGGAKPEQLYTDSKLAVILSARGAAETALRGFENSASFVPLALSLGVESGKFEREQQLGVLSLFYTIYCNSYNLSNKNVLLHTQVQLAVSLRQAGR